MPGGDISRRGFLKSTPVVLQAGGGGWIDSDGDGDFLDDLFPWGNGETDNKDPVAVGTESERTEVDSGDVKMYLAFSGSRFKPDGNGGWNQINGTGAKIGGVDSLGYVDAAVASDADLNDALANNTDGAVLYNGILTLDSTSINLPAGKTLYFYNGAGLKVDGAVGKADGTLNTQEKADGTRTWDIVIDARGNDNCGIKTTGGRALIDANITGATPDGDRMHVAFSNSTDNYILGDGYETRGGRGVWVWDVSDGRFNGGYHDHAADPNNQGSAIIMAEGCTGCEFQDYKVIGDPAATPNIKEALDLNHGGSDYRVHNIYAEDIKENAVDMTAVSDSLVENIWQHGSPGEGAVYLNANQNSSSELSSVTAGNADNVTITNVRLVSPSASSANALRVDITDDTTAKNLTAQDIDAVNARALRVPFSNSPSSERISGWTVECTSINSSAGGVNVDGPSRSVNWNLTATVRDAGGKGVHLSNIGNSSIDITERASAQAGVELVNCDSLTGNISSRESTNDALVMDGGILNALTVSLTNSGGYGINGVNSPDQNKYDGVVANNTNGQSAGLGQNSLVDVV